jgi:hypothetical protein
MWSPEKLGFPKCVVPWLQIYVLAKASGMYVCMQFVCVYTVH